MNDRDPREAALLRPRADLGVPVPAYSGRSLPNLSATLHDAFGGRRDGSPELLPPLAPDLDPFGGRRPEGPVVVVLVDGLGWTDFLRWADARPAGRGEVWRASAGPVTTVFPSTTTAALYSLATGAAPSRHGLLGYRQYLPRYGVVADMLKLSPLGTEARDVLVGAEWAPSDLEGPPTLARRGTPTGALTRDRFLSTGFTRLLYDGAEVVGYATATDLADELLQLLEREAPRVLFVYWDELDTIQHLKGPRPELFDLELERTVHLVEYVASRLPPARARNVRLLLTGDHGQVPATVEARLEVDRTPEVVREIARPPSGDRRSAFFTARPGRVPALRAALEAHAPPGSRLLEMERAVAAGLFGPPPYHPEIAERLGDLLLLPPSPGTVSYRAPGMPPPARFLFGAHGGLEPGELLVPLVSAPLAAFAVDGSVPLAKR